MTLHLNGENRELEAVATVQDLVRALGLGETPVLVEHNGTALFPRDFSATPLTEGDHLEIVRVVAGG